MPKRKWHVDRDGDHITLTMQVEGDVLEAGHRTIKLTQLRFPLEDLDVIRVLLAAIDEAEVTEE